ncbi:MAG: ion channel [Chloroflexi bacterium]|nr:ion channel [Chloroflexota bacterium]
MLTNRENRLKRLERLTETPMTLLAVFTIPLLLGPYLWDDEPHLGWDFAVWGVFAIELLVRTSLASDRRTYLRSHWVDVLLVAVPFFRPLRLLRIAVVALRIGVGVGHALSLERLLIYATTLAVVCACAARIVEPETFLTLTDALWWALVTMSTVGYGDISPATDAGKAVAVPLLVGGITVFGVLTANLASVMVQEQAKAREKA